MSFVNLVGFENDYEILNEFPFSIRKKANQKILKEGKRNEYIAVNLNNKIYYKHRLIAIQFIPNPNNLKEVDHINHDRSGFHLENLRWVSRSENARNRTAHINNVVYEYVDQIDDEAIAVTE